MRSRAVAVITVSLLLISVAAGYQLRTGILHLLGADRPRPGQPPFQAGRAWECPPGFSFKAYLQDSLFYPAYHPAPPPYEVRPERCFSTAVEAQRAGFGLAPPPKGGADFEGTYLVPPSARVRAECRNAAARIGFAIPCPTLLSAVSADDPCALNTGCVADAGRTWDSFSLTILFVTPPGVTGTVANPVGFSAVDAGSGQVILTVEGLQLATSAGRQINLCPRGRLGPQVMGTTSIWADCTGLLPDGKPRLTWLSGAVIYTIATALPTPATRRLVEFFASKLVAVG